MVIVDNDRPDDAQTLQSTGGRSGVATALLDTPLPDDPVERAAVLELLASEDQALLVRGNALLILDLGLDIVDGVRTLHL